MRTVFQCALSCILHTVVLKSINSHCFTLDCTEIPFEHKEHCFACSLGVVSTPTLDTVLWVYVNCYYLTTAMHTIIPSWTISFLNKHGRMLWIFTAAFENGLTLLVLPAECLSLHSVNGCVSTAASEKGTWDSPHHGRWTGNHTRRLHSVGPNTTITLGAGQRSHAAPLSMNWQCWIQGFSVVTANETSVQNSTVPSYAFTEDDLVRGKECVVVV